MSYELGDHHDGGYEYCVTINGLTMNGWRKGTRDEVEEYVRQAERMSSERSRGKVTKYLKNGMPRKSHFSET